MFLMLFTPIANLYLFGTSLGFIIHSSNNSSSKSSNTLKYYKLNPYPKRLTALSSFIST